jgi:predicted SnoaL-like aldol condensation-catalyzing enzyme
MTSPTDVVARLAECVTAGDFDAALELIAPDAIDHAPLPDASRGLEGWREKWQALQAASGGRVRTVPEQRVAQGDTVATRYSIRQADSDAQIGTALDMIRVRDGKVVEHWGLPEPTGTK